MNRILNDPIFTVALTVIIYTLATNLSRRIKSPLVNPILVSVTTIIAVLKLVPIDYQVYQRGGAHLSIWLGPATVALAIPLYRQLPVILSNKGPILLSIGAGATAAASSSVLLARFLNAAPEVVSSLLPKSVTTPIAIEVAKIIGANHELTAGFVIATGILGAIIGPECLNFFGITSALARGLALGTASHGIGTARAIQEGEVQGSASGLAIGIAGLLTALIAPLIAALLL